MLATLPQCPLIRMDIRTGRLDRIDSVESTVMCPDICPTFFHTACEHSRRVQQIHDCVHIHSPFIKLDHLHTFHLALSI